MLVQYMVINIIYTYIHIYIYILYRHIYIIYIYIIHIIYIIIIYIICYYNYIHCVYNYDISHLSPWSIAGEAGTTGRQAVSGGEGEDVDVARTAGSEGDLGMGSIRHFLMGIILE
jgi:hypothetical protein